MTEFRATINYEPDRDEVIITIQDMPFFWTPTKRQKKILEEITSKCDA